MEDIENYSIPVYNFPYDVEEDDEDTITENSELRVSQSSSNQRMLRSIPFSGPTSFWYCWLRGRD